MSKKSFAKQFVPLKIYECIHYISPNIISGMFEPGDERASAIGPYNIFSICLKS